MKSTQGAAAKRIRWSQCQQLSELALMIDAIPHELRTSIIRAAIEAEATDEQASHFVGEVRSLLIDSLAQLFGHLDPFEARDTSGNQLSNEILQLSDCQDPAEVQLGVCDLLESLVVHLSSDA